MPEIDLFPLYLSLKVAGVATVISFLVGIGLAWLLARRRFWGREVVAALVTIPLVLPPTVLGYYLLTTIGRQSPVGRFLEGTLGITLVFTWQAAVIASCIVSLPLMVRTAQAAMEAIDPDLEKAARTLGRSELSIFLTITVPLAWRGILAGTALAFARAMGEFGATLMVAGNIPGRTQTMSVAIYDAVQAGRLTLANTLVVILTAVTVSALAILSWAGRGTER
ncbi:MAG: molybdate ABC transporter permease subunit [Dehalococcoidia bacterium]|nr:molybdate ABC transporter permease subunit [Dehalococcoidia bacterium]